ncbi:hypothetical protein [Parabacteroides pacaensis]|uniref:hypothetical protein n=1 Tax=Parabacteroides pacaensis TaxID=2086575 RepID=UPI000D0EEDCE|nr:hypothetical protein [Parabacteroides pacaensis]
MAKTIIHISSYIGISFGAKHYYGKLITMDGEMYELSRPITQKELNDKPDRFMWFKVGESTKCFESYKDVILAGGEKAKELGIDLKDVIVDGIPNIKAIPYFEALKPLDTRLKCKSCGKVFGMNEGLYNTPNGVFCVNCYEKRK